MRVYLSGEIHTDWRDEIIASSKDLDITFEGPVTDHELSDDSVSYTHLTLPTNREV